MMIPMHHLIAIRPEPPGRYTAYVMGLANLHATAVTEQEALEAAKQLLTDWLAPARLVQVTVRRPGICPPLSGGPGYDTNEAEHQLYLDEIRRYRQEVDQQEWLDSSSTPTT
jgi:hypothetical protein